MLKNKLIVLSFMGMFCSVGMNVAFAASNTGSAKPDENINHDALDACKESKEGDGCMYIKDGTKFTGSCQKHEDKLTCSTIKS